MAIYVCCVGHSHWVLCVAWSPDGRKVASGCKNGDVSFLLSSNTQNPLHTIPGNFPVDGEVANVLAVDVMEFVKRHDTTDTTDFCPRQLVTDLSFMLRTCYGETGVMHLGFTLIVK